MTCDVAMRDWPICAVRSEEEMLAGAPRWSLMATFLSRSARDTACGDRFPTHTHIIGQMESSAGLEQMPAHLELSSKFPQPSPNTTDSLRD
jgi:hypothetical protein